MFRYCNKLIRIFFLILGQQISLQNDGNSILEYEKVTSFSYKYIFIPQQTNQPTN